jgi:hypothetical protein
MRQLQCTLLLLLLELIDEAAYYGTKMLTNFKIFSATHQNQTSSNIMGQGPRVGAVPNYGASDDVVFQCNP